MNSEFDKFESYTSKADSSFSQQLNIAAEEAMQLIRNAYGPFDKDEINFFKKRLSEGGEIKINSLQRMLALSNALVLMTILLLFLQQERS